MLHYKFFAINKDFTEENDGIFGLAPRDADDGPSIIKELKK